MKVVIVRPNSYILPTAPPMGPASIAAWLKLKRADDVSIIDARKERLGEEGLADRVAALSPDVVGIGALSVEARDAHNVAAAVKRRLPGVTLLMGGPHVSASSERVMDDANVDFGVVGEGEESARELLDAIEAGNTSEPVEGVLSRYAGDVRFGGPRASLDVNTLPVPAWDLLPLETYFRPGRNTHDTVPASPRCLQIMTSRGCPFRCIYCHDIFGRIFRPRSPQHVLSETRDLVERFRLEAIEICDDIFNLDMDRAKTILRGLMPMRIAISFPNGIRADRADDEMLDLMEAAGTTRVSFAVESASPRIQKVIRKGLDIEKVRRIITAASKKHFLSTGYFIFGFPDETAEEMEETIRFACESKLHIASFFYLTPFPGTEAAQIARGKGVTLDEQLHDYSTLHANLTNEPEDVLRRMRKKAYRKFYMNPGRIWRTFVAAPKNRQTFVNAWKVLLLSLRDSVNY